MPVTVVNSIVAGNTSEAIEEERSAAALAVQADDCDFPVGTLGGNLEGDTTCGFRGASDKQNADPKLAALAANGGLTRTHALPADSPAVNMAGAAVPGHRPARHAARRHRLRLRRLRARAPGHAAVRAGAAGRSASRRAATA